MAATDQLAAGVEKFHTPAEVAKMLGISEQSVRVQFRPVAGVLALGNGARKRLRIPDTVLQEWIRRHRVEGGN